MDVDFTVRVLVRNGVAMIALGGELDAAGAARLREQLARSEQDGVGIIVMDLRDLTFMDLSGLHVMFEAKRHAQTNGHRLAVGGVTAPVQRLFELFGTEFVFDQQEAVGALAQFMGSRG